MKIPVFHDDQHGTAIIVGGGRAERAAVSPARRSTTSRSSRRAPALRRLPASTCWSRSGARRENIWVTDIEGVVYEGRATLMDRWKSVYARKTDKRTLAEVIDGADIFLGLSAGGVLKPDMVKRMARRPLILALANPNPEIMPEEALGGAPGRDDLHRPLRLSQPGQQRPLLSLHLPRRPRRRRHRRSTRR